MNKSNQLRQTDGRTELLLLDVENIFNEMKWNCKFSFDTHTLCVEKNEKMEKFTMCEILDKFEKCFKQLSPLILVWSRITPNSFCK